jgi:hypothetical protein
VNGLQSLLTQGLKSWLQRLKENGQFSKWRNGVPRIIAGELSYLKVYK